MPLALLLTLLLTAQSATDTDWTPAGTKHGVVMAFRDDPRLNVREVRATTELPFPAARIATLVCDFRNYGTLVEGVQDARVISGTVPDDYQMYLRYAPRFVIVAARDVAVRVHSRSTPAGVGGCAWTNVEGREPERPGVARMPMLRGSWTVEPLDASRSRVVYHVAVDPGGRIPAWLVRRGAVSALPDVITQVRRRLGQDAAPTRP